VGVPFYVMPDGATVRIDERTAYEPDALVAPLPEPDDKALEIPDPVMDRGDVGGGVRLSDCGACVQGRRRPRPGASPVTAGERTAGARRASVPAEHEKPDRQQQRLNPKDTGMHDPNRVRRGASHLVTPPRRG
jgi:hypothetical protein